MLKNNQSKVLLIFLFVWIVVNLLTAGFSELSHDESYYWVYSRHLDWGYFDHPPMVALMDWIGYAIFPNEIGVRLLTILSTTLSIYLIYLLCDNKDPFTFSLICFSILPLNIFGFISLPDVPLLFFTALFFLVYKHYLKKDDLKNCLLMSIVIACLMYSKYHGILVIGFTILSNVKLLSKKSFWAVAFLSIVLFLPHIYWQIHNDFPSFKYHLVDRSTKPYKVNFTLDYLFGQILYYSPFIGAPLFFMSFRQSTAGVFERALKFNLIGIFAFFFLSTFKGSVEANWTIPALVPMLILSMKYLNSNLKLKKWIHYLSYVTVVLILLLRIHITYGFFYSPSDRTNEFKGWKQFAWKVKEKTGDYPLAANTYQKASKLYFYTQQPITALNINSRHNQFDFWTITEKLEGKKVYFLTNNLSSDAAEIILDPFEEKLNLIEVDSLPVFKNIFIASAQKEVKSKKSLAEEIEVLFSTSSDKENFRQFQSNPTRIGYRILKEGKEIFRATDIELKAKNISDTQKITIQAPNEAAEYEVRLFFYTEGLGSWGDGKSFILKIE